MLNDSSAAPAADDAPVDALPDTNGSAAASRAVQFDAVGASVVEDALVAALVEVEQYVDAEGWGQAPRVFSLVRTAELLRAEPALADQLGAMSPDSFTPIEDLDLDGAQNLEDALQSIRWPQGVDGCLAAFENPVLAGVPAQNPAERAQETTGDGDAAPGQAQGADADGVALNVPASGSRGSADVSDAAQTCRVVIGVLRDGLAQGVVRLPDGSLRGGVPTWAPNVTAALRETLLGDAGGLTNVQDGLDQ